MRIKTYIINLKESVDRCERLQKEITAFPFLDAEFVETISLLKYDWKYDSI